MVLNNRKKVKLWDIAKVLSWYAFKSKDFLDAGIPVIKIKNIKIGYVEIKEDTVFVDENFLSIPDKYHINRWDILISLTWSHISQWNSVVWRVALYREDNISLLNQRAWKIIPNLDLIDKYYLYFLLFSNDMRYKIASLSKGAASQANISPTDVESIEFLLPPLPTQKKIASILSNYDDLIENNTRRIKILEEQAQLIYKEWFVKFQFPWYESVQMIDSGTEFGEIPEGWEVKEIWSDVTIKKWKNITRETIVEWTIPVVAGWLSPAYFHDKPNVFGPVITISASGANSWYVNIYYEDIWASDCGYLSRKETNRIYFYNTQLKVRQKDISHLQRWAAQPHVYPKDVMSLQAIYSNNWIEDLFEKKVDSIYKEIANLQKQNQNLKQTRDMLIPKLVSGEVLV